MMRIMLKSKIQRAVVTNTNLNYEGSITIDESLMKRADIYENERVLVANISNGSRFQTYVMKGEKSVIEINGAAARLTKIGDRIIIMSFCIVEDNKAKRRIKPKIIILNNKNEIVTEK